MNMTEKKLLNLIAYWLFGTFVLVWASVTTYIGLFTNRDWLTAIRAGFPIWGITAVLCAGAYAGYRAWRQRQLQKETLRPTSG